MEKVVKTEELRNGELQSERDALAAELLESRASYETLRHTHAQEHGKLTTELSELQASYDAFRCASTQEHDTLRTNVRY